MSSFFSRIELLRPDGVSDAAWAKRLGIKPQTYLGLKRGAEPSETTIGKIAESLGKTRAEIRYGE